MNGIDAKFAELKKKGEKALIVYFTAGLPSPEKTVDIVKKAEKAGADIVELGIPFSDPIADGPVIQEASFRALELGINTDKVFGICAVLKNSVAIPYLLMTYYNPVYRYGLLKFAKKCAGTGVAGIIIPDLPWEESEEARESLKKYGIALIDFLTPFTPVKRAEKILKDAGGFVYLVTYAGVTGRQAAMPDKTLKALKKFRKMTDVPVSAGFGISTPEQVKKIRSSVDGVIVGSFLVKKIIDGKIEELWETIKNLKKELE
ncbi:MAG: tryptophan synthase subunit alpha [Candidatus Omnitrophica bacterium]|nr:tryptophan synthase subunit alpha [Candidatus Omnitrophota bacterium]